jgi:two-component system, response regulator PdtaR
VINNLSHRQPPHPPTILVVEDDELVRLVAVEFLEDAGFKVVDAGNADHAIELLTEDGPVDAVFSDIQMPGSMDGLGLARWISREKPEVKVLLTSGRVFSQPGPPVLPKPYDLAAVARRLKGMIPH